MCICLKVRESEVMTEVFLSLSSACKASDETESWSILRKATCCQTTVLNSSICPRPISPLPSLSTPLPFSFEYERDGGEVKDSFVSTFSPAVKVFSCGGSASPHFSPQQCCSVSDAVKQLWWFKAASRSVICALWEVDTWDRWVLSSLKDTLEGLHIFLRPQASALLAFLQNSLFPSQKMGLCLQRSWNMLLILHICSEWQCGSLLSRIYFH